MKSETLRNLRTMREVKNSLELARNHRPRTTNSLSRPRDEIEYLESLNDRQLEQVLEKERRRFGAQEASINKSRQRVLRSREKLAMTVNRNRALTELRRKLQQTRWEDNGLAAPRVETPVARPAVRQIELNY